MTHQNQTVKGIQMKQNVTRRNFLATAGLPCPSLVVVRQKGGKDEKWKLLDKTWEHVENPFKFNEYVEAEVERTLNQTGL